jgi:hypothetical protein
MQHTVAGDDGTAPPVGVPPAGPHEPPLAASLVKSITLPGSDKPPQAVGSSFTGPVCPHPSWSEAVHETPVGEPQEQDVHALVSSTPPYTVRFTE